ncbi:Holliday junction DNA helicase RuvA [compost metagenome]
MDIDMNNIYANNINEALSALMALGYTEKEAQKALSNADVDKSVEDIIKECLKMLMR